MPGKTTITALLLLLATGAVAQDETNSITLRAEAQQLERHMYELFNALNSDDDLDVTCGDTKVTGSTIPVWTCEAAFMRDGQANAMSARFDNPGAAMANTQGGFIPQSRRQTAFNARQKTRQLNDEMRALARQNAELAAAMIAFNDKRVQLENLEK
jgi:hypothetical protein